MSIVLNTNIQSLMTQRKLTTNNAQLNKSFEKLASGYKINKASDDAAGLKISETLSTNIRSNQEALNNAQATTNILQIAEGSLSVIGENLQRIRELSIQAANDTCSEKDREAISQEVKQRLEDINRIASSTRSHNVNLLDGSRNSYIIQIGSGSDITEDILDIGNVLKDTRLNAISITSGYNISASASGVYNNNGSIRSFMDVIDNALSQVRERRSSLGAVQNRLDSTVESLSCTVENLKKTNSRIKDTDVALETSKLAQNQIIQQASIGILSQANLSPNLATQLLN